MNGSMNTTSVNMAGGVPGLSSMVTGLLPVAGFAYNLFQGRGQAPVRAEVPMEEKSDEEVQEQQHKGFVAADGPEWQNMIEANNDVLLEDLVADVAEPEERKQPRSRAPSQARESAPRRGRARAAEPEGKVAYTVMAPLREAFGSGRRRVATILEVTASARPSLAPNLMPVVDGNRASVEDEVDELSERFQTPLTVQAIAAARARRVTNQAAIDKLRFQIAELEAEIRESVELEPTYAYVCSMRMMGSSRMVRRTAAVTCRLEAKRACR